MKYALSLELRDGVMKVGELMTPDRILPDIDKKPLYLWCAYPEDLLTEATARACASLLSEDERTRWQALRFDRDRREYLTTRTLVRTALSHHHPIASEAWRFETNAHGKPRIDPDCGLRFNLSNSSDLVVCLVSHESEVGVDVEPFEHAEKIAELAPGVLSQVELTQLEALRGSEKLDRVLSLWTLKEAYIKATGFGLSQPLNQFSFLFGGEEGIRLEMDPIPSDRPARNWRFCLVEHGRHRIALMAESATVPEMQLWEARPLLAPPTRLSPSGERWFPQSAVSV